MATLNGFCMRCKKLQPMSNVQRADITMKKSGKIRPAAKGVCSVCGTKMYKILSATDIV